MKLLSNRYTLTVKTGWMTLIDKGNLIRMCNSEKKSFLLRKVIQGTSDKYNHHMTVFFG